MDAHLPRPVWRGEGLRLSTGWDSLPSFKEGVGGKTVSGGAGGNERRGGNF